MPGSKTFTDFDEDAGVVEKTYHTIDISALLLEEIVARSRKVSYSQSYDNVCYNWALLHSGVLPLAAYSKDLDMTESIASFWTKEPFDRVSTAHELSRMSIPLCWFNGLVRGGGCCPV